jgi:hypothetical protein
MLKTRVVNALFILAILAGLVVLFGFIVPRLSKLATSAPRIAPTPTILQQVQTLAQLVTVQYVMEKVVDLSDTQWYKEFIKGIGENRVLMIAHGVVKAGIDLREIKQEDIIVTDRKIIIKLPPSRVTDAYLDDKLTKVVEYKTGLLRSFDKNLEQDARQQAVLDINRAAREAGILKDADERAKSQLKDLFTKMGYEVEFR